MDFFELLAQGADDANKKDGKNETAKGVTPEAEPVEQAAAATGSKEAAREAKRLEKEAAREAKQREKEQKRAEREEAREQRRLEREAEAEELADHEATEVDQDHDDPRAALAALLAGGPVADAVAPEVTEAAAEELPPTKPAPVIPEEEPVAAPVAAVPTEPVSAVPADIPNEPVDPVKKYEWTAPMPTAAASAVAAGGVVAAAGAAGAAGGGAGSAGAGSGGFGSGNNGGSGGGRGGDDGRKQRVIAWSVVAGVLVLVGIGAAVIAIPAINNNAAPTPSPTKTTESPTPTPSPTQTTESPTPTPTPTPTTTVDVGPTTPLDVSPWGVTFDLSTKFGATQWQITGNTLTMNNTLINSFPESCAALRTGWGVTKAQPPARSGVVVAGNAYNLAKPTGTCQADPDLYNEILGLTQAMVNTAKVLP